MNIQIHRLEDSIMVAVSGEIDEYGAEELKNKFNAISFSGARSVQVNFAAVTYIGSAGIGKLLLFYKDLAIRQTDFRLINVSEDIYLLLQDMKLDTVFPISPAKAS
jgi:anti-anti-sigma factor